MAGSRSRGGFGERGAVELPVPGHHSDGVLAFFDIAARDLEEALVGLALAGQHDDRVGGAGQAVRGGDGIHEVLGAGLPVVMQHDHGQARVSSATFLSADPTR